MIVTATAQGIRLVTQADHARLAADMLRLFRLEELVLHPRRELLLRAASEHDNGWWEADAAPRVDSSGTAALDFRSAPADLRQEVWRRGVERFASESPYVAALVATHTLRLLENSRKEDSWEAFGGELLDRRSELLSATGESEAAVAMDDPWLELVDGLSLAVCTGDPGFVARPGYRLEIHSGAPSSQALGPIEVAMDPFPFAGTTSFELSCRWLEPGRFTTSAALGVALATAPWRRDRVRLLAL